MKYTTGGVVSVTCNNVMDYKRHHTESDSAPSKSFVFAATAAAAVRHRVPDGAAG